MELDKALKAEPIEVDTQMNREYIPLPGGWEIQTKGGGSTFRICDPTGERLAIPDSPYLHEELTKMARDVNVHWNNAVAVLNREVAALKAELEAASASCALLIETANKLSTNAEILAGQIPALLKDQRRWNCVRTGGLMSDGRPAVSITLYEGGKYVGNRTLIGDEADIMVDAVINGTRGEIS